MITFESINKKNPEDVKKYINEAIRRSYNIVYGDVMICFGTKYPKTNEKLCIARCYVDTILHTDHNFKLAVLLSNGEVLVYPLISDKEYVETYSAVKPECYYLEDERDRERLQISYNELKPAQEAAVLFAALTGRKVRIYKQRDDETTFICAIDPFKEE